MSLAPPAVSMTGRRALPIIRFLTIFRNLTGPINKKNRDFPHLSGGHAIRCFAEDGRDLSHSETGKLIVLSSERESPVKYRSDIDGLRALAVIPVVAFHAGLPRLAGGFVGVDVFFVISGYLICGLIAADIERDRFSLLQFYKRRVMRIFPALFAMFLAASLLSYLYLLPVELKDYSKSLFSAVLSISNVYFSQTTGYFDAPAETKPLLHTWSLGVEEQFYLVCPLLMIAAYRFLRTRITAILAICAATSFLGLLLMNMRNPSSLFT